MLPSSLLPAAAVLTTPGVDVWGLVGRVLTTLLSVGSAALLFTWRAVSRAWFCAMLKSCRPDLKTAIDDLYSDRITTIDAAVDAVGVHADQIEGLEASIEAQGKALRDSVALAFERLTESTERMATNSAMSMARIENTLTAVHAEASENTAAIAKVVGFLEGKGWQGAERRSRAARGGQQ